MVNKTLKGISPVIATILMVMITVGLVAFAYTWFVELGEKAREEGDKQLGGMTTNFRITTAYECSDGNICFEFKASPTNNQNLPMNDSYISVYIDDAPVSLRSWDGGIGGQSCSTYPGDLAPGKSCYGNVSIPGGTCSSGDTHILKIIHEWGATKTASVRCK